MKLIVLTTLLQFAHSTNYRLIFKDEFLDYAVDPSIPPLTAYFNLDNFVFEQIDDDNVKMGGTLEVVKSMKPNLPLQMALRTQIYERAIWIEGPLRLSVPHICPELLNPTRFWYNVTKLFSPCPPKKGVIWPVEMQTMEITFNLPPSYPAVPTIGYVLMTQGAFGMENIKYGFGLQAEFVPLKTNF